MNEVSEKEFALPYHKIKN